ncbi:MAG TPA: YtxH domain-containing protein [Vicinamibacterales bacterium]|nr:YtxH domain-containing protein [Vicinamibacterales bacterium]
MTRWSDQESTVNSTFLLGALAGALVGAGVALLMAPKSGAEVRHDLSNGYNSVRDAAARRYRDVAERANAKLAQLEQRVDQYTGRTSTTSTMGDATSTSGFPQA